MDQRWLRYCFSSWVRACGRSNSKPPLKTLKMVRTPWEVSRSGSVGIACPSVPLLWFSMVKMDFEWSLMHVMCISTIPRFKVKKSFHPSGITADWADRQMTAPIRASPSAVSMVCAAVVNLWLTSEMAVVLCRRA